MDDAPIILAGTAQPGRLSIVWGLVAGKLQAHRRILRFAAVGAIGYVIYIGLLFLMYDLALLPFLPDKHRSVNLLLFTHGDALLLITTLVGTEASIIAVFAGHTLWTFADLPTNQKPLWLRFLQFEGRALVSTLGILTVTVNGLAVVGGVPPYLAISVGLVAAFTWNWVLDSRFIWRARSA